MQKFRHWPWEDRYWQYVEKGGHWLWIGGRNKAGYGTFYRDGQKFNAHRIAWEILVGPIPDGMELDHTCKVRRCVKVVADEFGPAHLQPVTHHKNVLIGDGWAGTHARSTHCPRGHEYDLVLPPTANRPNGGRWCRRCQREASRIYHAQRVTSQKRSPR
jgi:hypothetical protein